MDMATFIVLAPCVDIIHPVIFLSFSFGIPCLRIIFHILYAEIWLWISWKSSKNTSLRIVGERKWITFQQTTNANWCTLPRFGSRFISTTYILVFSAIHRDHVECIIILLLYANYYLPPCRICRKWKSCRRMRAHRIEILYFSVRHL